MTNIHEAPIYSYEGITNAALRHRMEELEEAIKGIKKWPVDIRTVDRNYADVFKLPPEHLFPLASNVRLMKIIPLDKLRGGKDFIDSESVYLFQDQFRALAVLAWVISQKGWIGMTSVVAEAKAALLENKLAILINDPFKVMLESLYRSRRDRNST